MAYSNKVIDHYENPRNVGSLDKSDPNVGTGLVGAPARPVRPGFPSRLRRGGEQALLVRREPAGQRRLALDHLEHRLLLAEEVLVGTLHDVDRAVRRDPGFLHLLDGPGDALHLLGEARLQRDEHLARTDSERGDQQSLDHLVRVRAHERAVLERRGLAFGRVAHRVARARRTRRDRPPLATGREAGATSAPQSRRADEVDRALGAELPGPCQPQATDVGGEVLVDRTDRLRREQVRRHLRPPYPQVRLDHARGR